MKGSMNPKNFFCFFSLSVFVFAALAPDIVGATNYYVSKIGNDSNPGTELSPFRTIKHGVSSLFAGDTLYVKSGDYYESVLSWQTPMRHGTSWDNPITIAAFPGDTVTIKPPSGQAAFWIQDPSVKYIIIDGFIMDGQGNAIHGIKLSNNTTHVRVQNSTIKNSKYTGVLVTICSGCTNTYTEPHDTYHEFINLHVHNNGSSVKDHGFYIETSHNLVEDCDVHHNSSAGGKFYSAHYAPGASAGTSANYNVLRYSRIYDNSQNSVYPDGSVTPAEGWILASGVGNEAYGNISYGQAGGFTIGYGAKNVLIYNNLVYDNKDWGIYVHGAWGGSTDARVFNNTVYYNARYGIEVRHNAKNTSIKNNIAFKNGPDTSSDIWLEPDKSPGTVTSNNLVEDPKFIDMPTRNLKLQPGSPAIDVGLSIPDVTIDFFGVKRAQGKEYDIGAIEYEQMEDTIPPSVPQSVKIY